MHKRQQKCDFYQPSTQDKHCISINHITKWQMNLTSMMKDIGSWRAYINFVIFAVAFYLHLVLFFTSEQILVEYHCDTAVKVFHRIFYI